MGDVHQQPEPCLGGIGTHDREGRCYSRIACSVFGYCRERAIKNRGSTPAERDQWKVEAKQRAAAEQEAYLAARR